jgi:hypothetical protein
MPYHFGPLERPVAIHFPDDEIFGFIEVRTVLRKIADGVDSEPNDPTDGELMEAPTGFYYGANHFIGGIEMNLYDGDDPGYDPVNYQAEQISLRNVYDAEGHPNFPFFAVTVLGAVTPSFGGGRSLDFSNDDFPQNILNHGVSNTDSPYGSYGVDFFPAFVGIFSDPWIPKGDVVTWPGTLVFGDGTPVIALGSPKAFPNDPPDNYFGPVGAPPGIKLQKLVPRPEIAPGAIPETYNIADSIGLGITNVSINDIPCTVLGYRYHVRNAGFSDETFELYALCKLSAPLVPPP